MCAHTPQVASFTKFEILSCIPFFAECAPDLLDCLLSVLRPATFSPHDDIITCGTAGAEMFFIDYGAAAVVSRDGAMTYAVLSKGVSEFNECACVCVCVRAACAFGCV